MEVWWLNREDVNKKSLWAASRNTTIYKNPKLLRSSSRHALNWGKNRATATGMKRDRGGCLQPIAARVISRGEPLVGGQPGVKPKSSQCNQDPASRASSISFLDVLYPNQSRTHSRRQFYLCGGPHPKKWMVQRIFYFTTNDNVVNLLILRPCFQTGHPLPFVNGDSTVLPISFPLFVLTNSTRPWNWKHFQIKKIK